VLALLPLPDDPFARQHRAHRERRDPRSRRPPRRQQRRQPAGRLAGLAPGDACAGGRTIAAADAVGVHVFAVVR
jgi:hypothetical protein